MQPDLVFLHTAAVHVDTFAGLLSDIAPGLAARHVVKPDLLDRARADGLTDALRRDVEQAMRDAAIGGARLVVCTCSTIGELAESVDTDGRFQATRIDRAMADLAVRSGRRITIVAALASTLAPTRGLLMDAARNAGADAQFADLLVEQAWRHFENGDREQYLDVLAQAIRAIQAGSSAADVIVLAQASMAPVADRLADIGIPVLASPRIGTQAAVARVQAPR